MTLFILLSDLRLSAALFLAALCHELSHYAMLRLFHANIKEINFTAYGAEMQMADTVGYGAEWLSIAAGPGVNLILAILMALPGRSHEIWYLFSGAQAVLGLFNLLPIRPMDGGNLLWITAALLSEPFTADRVCCRVGAFCAVCLTAACLWLLWLGGSVFPMIAAGGLLLKSIGELGLVKRRGTA